jgi:D-cysteine desulfhydrase
VTQTQKVDYPPRIKLAHIPTPLQKMVRLSQKLGVEMFFKRDDSTGSELSGNKIRKLEFILAEAISQEADTVITCGGAQSNHCRATALAAAGIGLKSLLLLRTPDPDNPPPAEGNILLDRLAGAEIVWITPDEYKRRDAFFQKSAEQLLSQGRKPYIIPEGGSNALGAWGYIGALNELSTQLDELNRGGNGFGTVISATGSGGTTAGLLLASKLLDLNVRVVGINVCDDRDYFLKKIGSICSDFFRRFAPQSVGDITSELDIVDGYVGRGYALSQPEELKAIRDLARLEGVILDPVYTGKAFFGMLSELEKNPESFGDRIVFIHTGGLFGLFPSADQFADIL